MNRRDSTTTAEGEVTGCHASAPEVACVAHGGQAEDNELGKVAVAFPEDGSETQCLHRWQSRDGMLVHGVATARGHVFHQAVVGREVADHFLLVHSMSNL